jgi:PII-like signaling protein
MSLAGEQILLRVYLQSADRLPHEPTYQRIVKAARSDGLNGCTVLEGIFGLATHRLLAPSAWALVRHVPVILEIVDSAQRIAHFVDRALGEYMEDGLATMERASVIVHRHGAGDAQLLAAMPGMIAPLSTLPPIQPRPNMTVNDDGMLLRVFIGESDRLDKEPLYQAIVHKARDMGLASATVLRGTEGFGAHSVVHKAAMLEMSSDLPIVIEMVDSAEKIHAILPHLDAMVKEGMITMENVRILAYRSEKGG